MQVDLFPKVSGYLERIHVNLGDSVRQGQVIAQIDRADFSAEGERELRQRWPMRRAQLSELEAGSRPEELRQAEEAVRQAQSRFDNAKLQRERVEALFKRQVISKKEMDIADMEYTVAEAQLGRQPAASENWSRRRSPSGSERGQPGKVERDGGFVGTGEIRLTEYKNPGTFPRRDCSEICRWRGACLFLYAVRQPRPCETLKMVANVLERDIPLLKAGMKASIRTEAYPERVFEGKDGTDQ
jgi:multidrug resistance efflux pump